MVVNFKLSFSIILIGAFEILSVSSQSDDKYQWFNVLSSVKSDCVLALDAHPVLPNCPGTAVIVSDLQPNKLTQQWRMDGNRLINRYSGLAVKRDKDNFLVFAHATNATNQMFSKRNDNKFIFANGRHDPTKVVSLSGKDNSNVGTSVNTAKGRDWNKFQMFRWTPFTMSKVYVQR